MCDTERMEEMSAPLDKVTKRFKGGEYEKILHLLSMQQCTVAFRAKIKNELEAKAVEFYHFAGSANKTAELQ